MRVWSSVVVAAVVLGCVAAVHPVEPVQASGISADPDDSIAAWSAKCEWVGNYQIDPIYWFGDDPGQAPNPPHMHSFAAAEDPHSSLTPEELRGNAPNDCNSPDIGDWHPTRDVVPDRSQYWVPSLRSSNLTPAPWVDPSTVLIYYRNAGVDPNDIRPFDQDFSIRAGDPSSATGQPLQVLRWSCVAEKQGGGGASEVEFGARIPLTCPKYRGTGTNKPFYLRLVVYFPNCIDFEGVTYTNYQWRPDTPKYATPIFGADPEDSISRECALPDYDAIPQVQIGFRWPLTTDMGVTTDAADSTRWDLSSLKLASDMDAGQERGESAHVDFMSGWSTEDLEALMTACYWDADHEPEEGNGPRNCGTIGEATPYGEN